MGRFRILLVASCNSTCFAGGVSRSIYTCSASQPGATSTNHSVGHSSCPVSRGHYPKFFCPGNLSKWSIQRTRPLGGRVFGLVARGDTIRRRIVQHLRLAISPYVRTLI